MIIGVIGTNGAGKDSAAEYLADAFAWPTFSMSDELREMAREQGLTTDRPVLQKLGNALRDKHGGDYISRLILQKRSDNFVISSIRNPQEIEPLRETGHFILLMLDADIRTRYERSLNRTRSAEDNMTFEEFVAMEASEHDGGVNDLRLKPVFELADVIIENDGTYEELTGKLDKFIEEVRHGQTKLG
jgi:dephospho-CoA kinase